MSASTTSPAARRVLAASAVTSVAALFLLLSGAGRADSEAGVIHEPKSELPAARIIVDQPKPDRLAKGVAIVPFRTENIQIVPVFGPAAAAVSPRLGHLHVTLDDAPWHWAHTSNDPIIVAPLPPGPHRILIELADANHEILAKKVVKFDVPADADAEFLTKVIPAIAGSVKVIDLAATNASDAKVRAFAEAVLKQHKESFLIATGHAKRLGVRSEPVKDGNETLERLSKLKGAELDAAFLKWLGDIHADAGVFELEVKKGRDADLKTYAKNSILAGEEHLKMSRELLKSLKK